MTRSLTGALIACVLGMSAAARQQPPIFRGGSDVVRVFVTVTDRDGRPVTTLAREQFEVQDNGTPQPLTHFDSRPQPIRLIVMLDVSGSMEGNLSLLRGAATQLFSRLRADDVARLGTFGRQVAISPSFTHDGDELVAALPRAIEKDAPTPLWRAIEDALDAFGPPDHARKVVLVLSDGKDSGPARVRERPASQSGVIDRARLEDVAIYGVGLHSRSVRSARPGRSQAGLQVMLTAELPDAGLARVAEETGGGYTEIRIGQDLGAAFAAIAEDLHTQYLLGFAPPNRDGAVHEIGVRINRNGLTLRARKSYVAPNEERRPD